MMLPLVVAVAVNSKPCFRCSTTTFNCLAFLLQYEVSVVEISYINEKILDAKSGSTILNGTCRQPPLLVARGRYIAQDSIICQYMIGKQIICANVRNEVATLEVSDFCLSVLGFESAASSKVASFIFNKLHMM